MRIQRSIQSLALCSLELWLNTSSSQRIILLASRPCSAQSASAILSATYYCCFRFLPLSDVGQILHAIDCSSVLRARCILQEINWQRLESDVAKLVSWKLLGMCKARAA